MTGVGQVEPLAPAPLSGTEEGELPPGPPGPPAPPLEMGETLVPLPVGKEGIVPLEIGNGAPVPVAVGMPPVPVPMAVTVMYLYWCLTARVLVAAKAKRVRVLARDGIVQLCLFVVYVCVVEVCVIYAMDCEMTVRIQSVIVVLEKL